jgi:frataxin
MHLHRYTTALLLRCNKIKIGSGNNLCNQIRLFQNVSQYHNVADDTLHSIQDAVEDLIEDNFDTDTNNGDDDALPEVNYASGVLTLSLPPHGTWVINKQTPNHQLWWSSPLSGPRRYEYVEERERWVYTRVIEEGDGKESAPVAENDEDTLGSILTQEIKELYGWDLDLEA